MKHQYLSGVQVSEAAYFARIAVTIGKRHYGEQHPAAYLHLNFKMKSGKLHTLVASL
jgi:hypothetical protein